MKDIVLKIILNQNLFLGKLESFTKYGCDEEVLFWFYVSKIEQKSSWGYNGMSKVIKGLIADESCLHFTLLQRTLQVILSRKIRT